MEFIGRKEELEILRRLQKKRSASLAVVWGRRRIGKSTLIAEFVKGTTHWGFTGMPPTSQSTAQEEINLFVGQMARNVGMPKLQTSDWGEVFWHLGIQAARQPKLIIVLDEISWMGSKDSNFLGYLKTEWDNSFSRHPHLILILCGSVSTWIEKNILSSTGFFGRISVKLELKELSLCDCNDFWGKQKKTISAYEKFKVLAVTGGVPKYLEEIMPLESAEKNINHLCFRSEGILFREYDQIFSDLFSRRAPTFDKIVRALETGEKSLDEICDNLKIEKSGNISEYLQELILSGFVCESPTWNIKTRKTSNLKTFRLKDNYLRFYLKFIFLNISKVELGAFVFNSLSLLPGWEGIMGLQFENLVLNNWKKICEILHIDLQDVEKVGPFFQKKTLQTPGCQIDLLIQTKFGTLYLCEIKFYAAVVGMGIVKEMAQKIDKLKYPKGYSLRPILIHVNGVSQGVIDSGFFDVIIDFSEFFKH